MRLRGKEHDEIGTFIKKGGLLIDEGIQSDFHGPMFAPEARKDTKGLKDIAHIVDVQFDLLAWTLLVLIPAEDRFLISILEKELRLTVDPMKEGLPGIGFWGGGEDPPFR